MKHDPAEYGVSPHARTPIRVRAYRTSDGPAWDGFVLQCPEATFFHRAGWRKILEEVFGHRTHYLLAERCDVVVGILPLAEVRSRLFGHSLTSLPFCAYGGVAVIEYEAMHALHEHAAQLAQKLDVGYLELRNLVVREPRWARQNLYVTFRKEIAPDNKINMLTIPRKQRAMVRKAVKAGLRSVIDLDVSRFYQLYADNMHRHGTPPHSRRYFEALQRVFGDDCEILTVEDPGGQPLSSVLSFYFRDEVLPYHAGDRASARELAANDFKYWELMRRAAGRGYRVFDYGRSKQGTGSFDFKKNWGFEPTPLSYEVQLIRASSIPQNNPLNPKYRALIALWRRLPIGIANALGPYIVRNLG